MISGPEDRADDDHPQGQTSARRPLPARPGRPDRVAPNRTTLIDALVAALPEPGTEITTRELVDRALTVLPGARRGSLTSTVQELVHTPGSPHQKPLIRLGRGHFRVSVIPPTPDHRSPPGSSE